MIGIDIVDIKDPLLHLRTADHLRFIEAEGDQYPEHIDPILLYWIVWSAKEAVFKSKRQLKSFDPKLITVILYDFEPITTFTLVARAHSVATRAPRYRFHRLDPGRLSGKFGSEILQLQRSPQPGGVPGSYMHAW